VFHVHPKDIFGVRSRVLHFLSFLTKLIAIRDVACTDAEGLHQCPLPDGRRIGLVEWRKRKSYIFRDVAQSGSVPAWGAGGRWFESSHPD